MSLLLPASSFVSTDLISAEKQLLLKESPIGNELLDILQYRKLQTVFQPIVNLEDKKICAVEALIRGPFESALHRSLNLFSVAEEFDVLYELDNFARLNSLQAFTAQVKDESDLHLFLNISVNAVMNENHQKGVTLDALEKLGISPERVVIEITELQPIEDHDSFMNAIAYYRSIGFKVALDDLGSGYNGLKIWSEMHPDFVKIDRHFVSDIHLHADKKAFLKSMLSLANSMGTLVIAEGVETEQELKVLIDLGINYVQGYLFKKPELEITRELHYNFSYQVNPESQLGEDKVADIAFEHPYVSPESLVSEVSEKFLSLPNINYFPVLKAGKIQGMVWRRDLMDVLARKFGQELHSRKKIKTLMDSTPYIADARTSLEDLSRLITDSNEFDSKDAFIIERDGNYLGCGDFKNLLRRMTDLKIEMAQQANPLSGLPGNLPVQKKLNELLQGSQPFMVIYIDVDNFKAFNDNYSFDDGDKIINKIADILTGVVPDEQVLHGDSFIGHIGGDDFVVLSQHVEQHLFWSQAILEKFKAETREYYSEADQDRGGIEALDRQGNPQFFPLMSLSLGILLVEPGRFDHRQQLSSYATKAKKGAKKLGGNTYYIVDSKHIVI